MLPMASICEQAFDIEMDAGLLHLLIGAKGLRLRLPERLDSGPGDRLSLPLQCKKVRLWSAHAGQSPICAAVTVRHICAEDLM